MGERVREGEVKYVAINHFEAVGGSCGGINEKYVYYLLTYLFNSCGKKSLTRTVSSNCRRTTVRSLASLDPNQSINHQTTRGADAVI